MHSRFMLFTFCVSKSFCSGAEELGDLVSELKLAVFQLGISPYIFSSIVMQVMRLEWSLVKATGDC